ncbi:MAG: F0F1 ATP synthase subunit epsilon [Propionibacteriales bacterium]|nr:F0F1 ATP synthase subunit epsilon [Propionibacteriales bacterium]
MADNLQVDLVAADRVVWSGEASMVVARTTDGEVGILKDHAPVLSVLVQSGVELETADNGRLYAVVDGGFLSVANNKVSILSSYAQLADEIDVAEARRALEEARSSGDDGPERENEIRLAEARVWVAEKSS